MELAASASIPWSWRGSVEPRQPVEVSGYAFPQVPDGRRHVGLFHADLGADASAVRGTAAAFAAAGFVPHLLARGRVPTDLLGVFATTSLLPHERAPASGTAAPDRYYCGARIDRPDRSSLAAFGWLDAVVVFALKDALPSLGELRAGGTVTVVASNKPGERAPLRRDDDLPYLLAAYEHATDAFVVERDTATWLTAMGIPRSKVAVCEELSPARTLVAAVERCWAKKDRAGAVAHDQA